MSDTDIKNTENDRGIASVTEERSGQNNTGDTQKKIIIGIIMAVALLWIAFSYLFTKPIPVVEETKREKTIKASGTFQPVEIVEETSVEVERIDPAPLGPIGRNEAAKEQAPTEPTEAELLIESARRAPVMTFSGTANNIVDITPETSENNNLFGNTTTKTAERSGDKSIFKPKIAGKIPFPHLTIRKGDILPCSLDGAIDSNVAGNVVCTLNEDALSSTGAVVLMEKGTKLFGSYQGGLQRGTKRIFVQWTSAETPNGVFVDLESNGTDALGRAGFDGDIDTQFWARFGGTLLLSVIDDVVKVATSDRNNNNGDLTTISNGQQLAQTELSTTVNVPTILSKNQGEIVAILVANHIDFSDVYELKRH